MIFFSKQTQFGRSMIEMFGVLAVIAVLTVGGITGYTKAMMKYKLNKQTEQIVSILNYANINIDMLFKSFSGSYENVTEIFKDVGAFPEEMIKTNIPGYVYDVLGNRVKVAMLDDGNGYKYFELTVSFKHNTVENCVNLALIAKQYSKNLWRIKYIRATDIWQMWGDLYCTKNNDCLKDITIAELVEKCKMCENNCVFMFQREFRRNL